MSSLYRYSPRRATAWSAAVPLVAAAAWACWGMALAEEQEPPVSGAIGADVPSFYVREVTGSRPNQAICLVCRYGGRPAVLVCARGLDEQVQDLLVKLDRVVDGERAHGLRGFAIFLDAKATELQPKLFNLARREKLSLPLAFPVETGGPRALDLPEKAQVTVLMYRRKKIEQRFVFDPDALNEKEVQRVVKAAKSFAEAGAADGD
jgi:hypothetical protein